MSGSLIFDTVVGMVFVFAIFTFAVSGVVEGLARLAGLRAEFLLRGISSMLDSNTKFDKGWLARLAQNAIDEQERAAQNAILGAIAKVDKLAVDAPARNEIKAALVAVRTIVPPRQEITDAAHNLTAAKKELQALAKSATADARAAAEKKVTDARTKQEGADLALKSWRDANPNPREIAAAKTAIDAVPPLLAQAQEQIDSKTPPHGVSLETVATGLATSRQLFLLAQEALEVMQGSRKAISAASLISEPVVDLTAALNVPNHLESRPIDKRLPRSIKWQLPSYLSSRTFSRALVHTLVPSPSGGNTTLVQVQAAVDRIGDEGLRKVLAGYIDEAGDDVEKFRTAVQEWYDDHMKRVTGWYKRHTRWYTLAVATILAVAFNINAIAMAQALYTDQALRESVVTAAFDAADCTADDAETTPAECLEDVRGQIDRLRGTGLPVGWSRDTACVLIDKNGQPTSEKCSLLEGLGLTNPSLVDPGKGIKEFDAFVLDLRQFALVVLGWVIIAATALIGARFWFDALSKLGSLRSSGPKPDSSV